MSLSARYTPSSSQRDCGGGDGGDAGARAPEPGPVAPRVRPPCARCSARVAALRVRSEFFCRACFLASTVARVRRSLAAPALLGARVLLGVSGGGSSRLLLDAAAYVMHCGRRRRTWEDACVVHVDTSCLWPLLQPADVGVHAAGGAHFQSARDDDRDGAVTRGAALETLLTASLSAGLNTYIVPLESCFSDVLCVVPVRARALGRDGGDGARRPTAGGDPEQPFAPWPESAVAARAAAGVAAVRAARMSARLSTAREALHAAFSRAAAVEPRGGDTPADASQMLLSACVSRLLAEMAVTLDVRFLLTAATVDRAALDVFCATAGGAGASVPWDVARADSRFEHGIVPPPRGGSVMWVEDVGSGGDAHAHGVRLGVGVGPDGGAEHGGDGEPAAAASFASWSPFIALSTPWYEAARAGLGAGVEPPPPPPQPGGVRVVRVAQDVERREVALFCTLRGLSRAPAAAADFCTFLTRARGASVRARCAETLAGLQAAFPATVHNVVRTARKLVLTDATVLCETCAAVLGKMDNCRPCGRLKERDVALPWGGRHSG